MNGKYLLILSAMLVTAALAFVSLHLQFDGKRAGAQQRIEPMRVAQRDTALPRAAATTTTAASSSQAVDELSARMQQLQRQLDDLKRQDTASTADEANAAASMPAESEVEERERTLQTTAFLQDNFVAETKDPTWSLQAERQVSDTFNTDEISAGSQLQQLSCQATLCRIESHHRDPHAERAFLTRLGRLNSFGDAEAFSERIERSDGSIEAVTYVSRNGHRLPRME